MKFEKWQKCEVLTSDGNWTIGYVDGKPAQWEGNMDELAPGDEFSYSSDENDPKSNGRNTWMPETSFWA